MHIRHKESCRVCGNKQLKSVIDLQDQYLQGSFVKEGTQTPPFRKVPTQLVRCDVSGAENACGLLQLKHSIPPEILYANYWYRSGTNRTMRDHLGGIAAAASKIIGTRLKRALDIGCNDGTLLNAYAKSVEKWGVDPSDIAAALKPPINVIKSVFPSPEVEHRLHELRFDVVTSIAMFYDLEDPVGFARSTNAVLDDKGVWILEMSYMPLMLMMNSFDTICHEHLEYYSLSVLQAIVERAGMRIFKVELNYINGGSIRAYCCKDGVFDYETPEARDYIRRLQVREFEMQLDSDAPYVEFQQRISTLREKMIALLDEIHARGEIVHIYGASTKGNVLLQWYGIDSYKVPYAADRNPDKAGAMTLGTRIKIISEEESRAMKPDYYLVLPWHFRAEFLKRERATIESGTKMIFPLPDIEIVDGKNLNAAITEENGYGNRLEAILGL
ncbi:MAG: class I SAM-dependent methyltransferase [Caulobacteraceae bacterium]